MRANGSVSKITLITLLHALHKRQTKRVFRIIGFAEMTMTMVGIYFSDNWRFATGLMTKVFYVWTTDIVHNINWKKPITNLSTSSKSPKTNQTTHDNMPRQQSATTSHYNRTPWNGGKQRIACACAAKVNSYICATQKVPIVRLTRSPSRTPRAHLFSRQHQIHNTRTKTTTTHTAHRRWS